MLQGSRPSWQACTSNKIYSPFKGKNFLGSEKFQREANLVERAENFRRVGVGDRLLADIGEMRYPKKGDQKSQSEIL